MRMIYSICARGTDIEKQQETLQAGLDAIEAYLCRVGMKAAPEKTKYTVVTTPRLREAKLGDKLNLVLAAKKISPPPLLRFSNYDRRIRKRRHLN